MDKKDMERLAADPRFIAGVYNYCDRWCERCPLSHRCLTFAMEQNLTEADPEARDIRNQKFWNRLQEVFQLTMEMIRADAARRGVDMDAPDVEAEARKAARKQRQDVAQAHPLLLGARQYGEAVDQWFREAQADLRRLGVEWEKQVRLGAGDPVTEAEAVQELLEVIRWYQYFVAAKLSRAIAAGLDEDAEGREILLDVPRDSDGSAKVALIAVDRSLSAWTALRERVPDQGDAILDLLVLLARLRKGAEARFPEARSFVRPGFDEELREPECGYSGA